MTTSPPFDPSASVVAQVAQLSTLPMSELKHLWHTYVGQPPTTHVRTFLERRLAYHIQVDALERHAPEQALAHQQRIHALRETPLENQQAPTLTPGTLLTRRYQGHEHHVTVTHDGQFEWNGQLFTSLSAIARDITGTRWSGPLFFGLRKPSPKQSHRGRS